jgi:uncharacterized protein (DUF2249 family)
MPVIDLSRPLDLREVAAPQADRVFQALDDLQPGQAFVLIADSDPSRLLERLQAERPGRFEWSPLEEGPPCWRVQVTRRHTNGGPLREITEALEWDHDRLEDLEHSAFAARDAGDGQEASRLFAEFARGLRRHIGFEEDILFPAFEQRTGIPPGHGPTAVMRAEHKRIESLLDRIAETIETPGAAAEELRSALHEVLGAHNVKEEQVLYPGTDRMLGPHERDALVRRIQAFRHPGGRA